MGADRASNEADVSIALPRNRVEDWRGQGHSLYAPHSQSEMFPVKEVRS